MLAHKLRSILTDCKLLVNQKNIKATINNDYGPMNKSMTTNVDNTLVKSKLNKGNSTDIAYTPYSKMVV